MVDGVCWLSTHWVGGVGLVSENARGGGELTHDANGTMSPFWNCPTCWHHDFGGWFLTGRSGGGGGLSLGGFLFTCLQFGARAALPLTHHSSFRFPLRALTGLTFSTCPHKWTHGLGGPLEEGHGTPPPWGGASQGHGPAPPPPPNPCPHPPPAKGPRTPLTSGTPGSPYLPLPHEVLHGLCPLHVLTFLHTQMRRCSTGGGGFRKGRPGAGMHLKGGGVHPAPLQGT